MKICKQNSLIRRTTRSLTCQRPPMRSGDFQRCPRSPSNDPSKLGSRILGDFHPEFYLANYVLKLWQFFTLKYLNTLNFAKLNFRGIIHCLLIKFWEKTFVFPTTKLARTRTRAKAMRHLEEFELQLFHMYTQDNTTFYLREWGIEWGK